MFSCDVCITALFQCGILLVGLFYESLMFWCPIKLWPSHLNLVLINSSGVLNITYTPVKCLDLSIALQSHIVSCRPEISHSTYMNLTRRGQGNLLGGFTADRVWANKHYSNRTMTPSRHIFVHALTCAFTQARTPISPRVQSAVTLRDQRA